MGFLDFLKETSERNGDTPQERITSEMQGDFDRYFANTPNRATVDIDGTEEVIVIQHIRYGEDKYDNQIIISQNSTIIDYGSKITWDSNVWLVINQEKRAIKTHKPWKMILTQNLMVSKNEFGEVNSEPCHLTTASSSNDGNTNISLLNNSWRIRVQSNPETLSYFTNQRFIFDNKVAYKIVNLNYSEFENQISITLEPTQIMKEDDLDNNIAYNSFEINTVPQTGKNGVFFTNDKLNISDGNIGTIEVYEYVNDIIQVGTTFTFRIDDIDVSKYIITSSDGNSIDIQALDYYYVGKLVAIKDGDLSETEIELTLSSLLG